jgi:TRAP-type C4-dicarboxylate transport system substrate-binding protein
MMYVLNEIWKEAYDEIEGVKWLDAGAWGSLLIFTTDGEVKLVADMRGLRVFGVPTVGRFLAQYGMIPVTVPCEDVEVAPQTGELDGMAWGGFPEAYQVD